MPVTGRTTKAIGPPLSVVAGLNYPRGLLSPSRSSVAQLVSVLVRSSSLSSRRSRAHLVLPISATRHPSGFFFLFPKRGGAGLPMVAWSAHFPGPPILAGQSDLPMVAGHCFSSCPQLN